MPIATKTAAALLALFLVLLGCAWIGLQAAVLPGFERLEAEAHERDRARVEANLRAMAEDLRSRALDYAHWDDTYAFVNGRAPGYPEVNFYDAWFESYNVDLIAFADEQGRLLWTRARSSSGNVTSSPEVAAALVRQARAADVSIDGLDGVTWTALGPLAFAAAKTSSNDASAPPRGVIVLARRLSAQSLREQAQLDLSLVRAVRSREMRAHQAELAAQGSATWSTPRHMRSLIALRNPHGEVIGAVYAYRPRDTVALGVRQINTSLLVFAGLAALAVAALWLLLRHLVLSRVVRLERHFNAQSSHAPLQPLLGRISRDEIGRLTDAYNALVLRVRDAMAREREAIMEREAAAAANRMKSDFLSNISYELRTPLNDVIGYSELVEEDLQDIGVTVATPDLRRIRASARRLIGLTNELLDLSRIEAGKLEVKPASFRIEETLRCVAETMRPLLEQNGNSLELDIAPGIGVAYSDETRLRQSLVNIVSIASRFTRNGVVALSARRLTMDGPDRLWFEVTDTGAGLTQEQIERLFEPFMPADATLARDYGGTGLGLAITRKVIAFLGGAFEVMSAPGRGSTFVITIPAIVSESSTPTADAKPVAAMA